MGDNQNFGTNSEINISNDLKGDKVVSNDTKLTEQGEINMDKKVNNNSGVNLSMNSDDRLVDFSYDLNDAKVINAVLRGNYDDSNRIHDVLDIDFNIESYSVKNRINVQTYCDINPSRFQEMNYDDKGDEIMINSLLDDTSRKEISEFISNGHSLLRDIITSSVYSKNGQLYIGKDCTSDQILYDIVMNNSQNIKTKFNNFGLDTITENTKMFIFLFIRKSMDKLNMITRTNDIFNILDTYALINANNFKDTITFAIVRDRIRDVITKIDYIIYNDNLGNRSNAQYIAQIIMDRLYQFNLALITLPDIISIYSEVLSLVKSYISKKIHDYFDISEQGIFNNASFLSIASNFNVIMDAINHNSYRPLKMSLYYNEFVDKVYDVIFNNDNNFIKINDIASYINKFDVNVMTNNVGDKKYITLIPNIKEDKQYNQFYRGKYNNFIGLSLFNMAEQINETLNNSLGAITSKTIIDTNERLLLSTINRKDKERLNLIQVTYYDILLLVIGLSDGLYMTEDDKLVINISHNKFSDIYPLHNTQTNVFTESLDIALFILLRNNQARQIMPKINEVFLSTKKLYDNSIDKFLTNEIANEFNCVFFELIDNYTHYDDIAIKTYSMTYKELVLNNSSINNVYRKKHINEVFGLKELIEQSKYIKSNILARKSDLFIERVNRLYGKLFSDFMINLTNNITMFSICNSLKYKLINSNIISNSLDIQNYDRRLNTISRYAFATFILQYWGVLDEEDCNIIMEMVKYYFHQDLVITMDDSRPIVDEFRI